jgi:hypothetical protein
MSDEREQPSQEADDSPRPSPRSEQRRGAEVTGRLAMLTGASLLLGAVPIPIVPTRVLRQLRGAVAHDTLARHGLSVVSAARDVFAEPDTTDRTRQVLRKGVEFASRRLLSRLGPFSALSAAARAFEIYALGHLLARYATQVRPTGTVRVQEAEARAVRQAIDRAALRAFSPSVEPRKLLLPAAPEDLRDDFTRWLDTLVLTAATLPSYLERRLDAAFDEIVAQTPELGRAAR